jgi:hypothetical protein
MNKLILAALAFALSACGKSDYAATTTSTSAQASVATVYAVTTSTSTSTSTTTSTGTLASLSFSFTLLGSQSAVTPAFSSDNVLKAKFSLGSSLGNGYHSATEFAVTIQLNGISGTPQFTASSYTYGEVGETSNVIDLSGYVSQGSNVQLRVINPLNNYYCTYAPNPFYYWNGTQYAPHQPALQ